MNEDEPYGIIESDPLDAISQDQKEQRAKTDDSVEEVLDGQGVVKLISGMPGGKDFLRAFPAFEVELPRPIATFSVCGKTGTAQYLDFWDCDHFDTMTHLQASVAQCRAWFSAGEHADSGSTEQTKTGRVFCYFTVPATGWYTCIASLRNSSGPARVECLLDGNTFGQLSFSGPITQPHVRQLAAGRHYFQINQVSGGFYFLKLDIWAS